MLSILIPVYNYNVAPLVKELYGQVLDCGVNFEILVYDDASTLNITDNETINQFKSTTFKKLPKNIGRSAIRNLLAHDAQYKWILFLDADTKIIKTDFINTYLTEINNFNHIVYGGICYQKNKPKNNEMLRWVYGKKREALKVSQRNKNPHLRFLTLNFLIQKDIFNILKFNTDIPNLRHEDTLFALNAKEKNITVKHINNPVKHLGLESSMIFLKKTDEATEVLYSFIEQKMISPQDTALTRAAELFIKYKLHYVISALYLIFKKPIKKQLLSRNPSLLLFDFYRLGYYLQLSTKK